MKHRIIEYTGMKDLPNTVKWLYVDFTDRSDYSLYTCFFTKGFTPARLNQGNDYYLIGRHD